MLENYIHFNKFTLRIPNNPLDKAFEAFKHKNFVKEILFKDSFFLESIFIASVDVYNAILKYDRLSDTKKKNLEITVLKYWLRSSTRCTPFGQFSGVSIGYFDDKTSTNSKQTSRLINLDLGILKGFSNLVSTSYKDNDKILFYPNSTIYKVLDELRYIEYYLEQGIEKFMLSRVNYNYYTNLILDFTKDGKTFHEIHNYLKKIIIKEGEIIIEAASIGFIEKIITSQLLVNNLEPIISGEDYFEKILSISKNVNSTSELIKIKKILEFLNSPNNHTISEYQKLIEIKDSLLPYNNDKNIFHTNLIYKFKTNVLNSSIPKKLKKAIEVIYKLCPVPNNIFLENFKKEFLAKYDTNEVPLSILFDNEVGLDFYKNPNHIDYIDDLKLNTNTLEYITNPNSEFLSKKLEIVIKENKNVLELFDEEINNLKQVESLTLHNTFSCFIEIYNKPEKIFVSEIGGSSAANYISRFSLDDTTFEIYTKEIITKEIEIEKNNIIAEIFHLPQSKNSNVLSRKVNREYVINYLSNPTTNKKKILISDLLVRIKNDKIILFSKILKKEITPTLTNAHNYEQSTLPIYKFLCSLQEQHYTTSLSFYWGKHFKNYKWLPRVSYKNFIISKARWILKYDELIVTNNIDEFRTIHKLPRYIEIGDDDKRLFIDLDSSLSFEILLSYAKKRKTITAIEYLFNTDNGLSIDHHTYSNEYLISYHRNEK